MSFTRGRKAIGICDQCGLQYKLNKLKYGAVAGRTVRSRLCPDCWDPDDPKDKPSTWVARPEAIAVRDPRIDPATPGMNSLVGWGPVLGIEIPVYPDADGYSMMNTYDTAPRYVLSEDGLWRLAAEDGSLIWAEG